MDNRKPVDQKQKADEQAALMEAQEPGRDDAAQNDPAYYRSQKEVDAAFARRLAAARRKWSQEAGQPAMQLQQGGAPMMGGPAMAEPAMQKVAPVQQRPDNPAGSMAEVLPQQSPMADGLAGAPITADPNVIGQADGLNRMALKLLAEEADIQQVFPGFDLESFLASDEAVRDALLQGRSLWSVFAGVYGGMVRQQAEAEALERVRSRNDAVPDVLRAGGAAGAAAPDYAGMPSDQFNRLRKQYEEQIRMGKRIKP